MVSVFLGHKNVKRLKILFDLFIIVIFFEIYCIEHK